MQQRRLRLGDILDDYCPRERRITNHAVVAMIDDEVKQTRCTTCDADHEYKQARVPPQRKKRIADGVADAAGRLRAMEESDTVVEETASAPADEEPLLDEAMPVAQEDSSEPDVSEPDDDGPVHRRLIRATLPRPDGHSPDRKEPEFTVRQPGVRGPGGHKRGRHQRSPHGQGAPPARFGSPRHGGSQAPRHGNAKGPRHAGGADQGHRQGGNRPASPPRGPRGPRQGPGGGRGGRRRGR